MYGLEKKQGYDQFKDCLIDIIASIKEIPEKLNEFMVKPRKSSDGQIDNVIEKKYESLTNFMYPHTIERLFRNSEALSSYLKSEKLINEYNSFLEIQTMMKTILEKELFEIDEDELDFLEDVLGEFIEHINHVIKLCKSQDIDKLYENKEYFNNYNVFRRNFFDYQMKFYTEIASSNDKYKNTIDKLYECANI